MLPFTVTIGPNEEDLRVSRLLCDVGGDRLISIGIVCLDGRFKKGGRRDSDPITILLWELGLRQVAKYAGHIDIAGAPCWIEIERKAVVFDILIPLYRSLCDSLHAIADSLWKTHCLELATAKVLGYCLCNCRLLGHAQDLPCH